MNKGASMLQVHLKFIEVDLLSQRGDTFILSIAFPELTKARVGAPNPQPVQVRVFVNTAPCSFIFTFLFCMRKLNILSYKFNSKLQNKTQFILTVGRKAAHNTTT